MSGIFTKVRSLRINYHLVRGMVSYAIIWPTCSLVQEYIEHGTTIEDADIARAARFGIFGTFFMAPVFYGWMKYTSRFFRSKSLKTAILRAAIEQVSYSPLAMAYFFFGMSLLELKPVKTCVNEVREKFWPTYKIGVVFWPTAQTLNFYFISEKNRIIFVSAASFVWTVYLAHMKAKEQKMVPKALDTDMSDGLVIAETTKTAVMNTSADTPIGALDTPIGLLDTPSIEAGEASNIVEIVEASDATGLNDDESES